MRRKKKAKVVDGLKIEVADQRPDEAVLRFAFFWAIGGEENWWVTKQARRLSTTKEARARKRAAGKRAKAGRKISRRARAQVKRKRQWRRRVGK